MSENILQRIQEKFPSLNLKKLSGTQGKKIANAFFKSKSKKLSMYSSKDLKNIKINGNNVFSSFQEDEKTFYRLELTMEQ